MAGTPHHQGVVARVAGADYADLEDLLAFASRAREPAFFLALDQVQDPRNLGALLRTAEASGVHGVIVPKHHAVGLTRGGGADGHGRASSTSPVARETNLVNALESAQESGYLDRWARPPTGGQRPWRADLRGPVCLVLGSEGEGLRPLVARTCDVLVYAPHAGRVGSLNVSAAGAVLCYEVGASASGAEASHKTP